MRRRQLLFDEGTVKVKQEKPRPAGTKPIRLTVISGPLPVLPGPKNVPCRYFNINGREVHNRNPSAGIYFIKVGEVILQKVIKIR
jgi:hypothetical protein